MSKFSLEVEAAFVEGAENDVTEQLDSVLAIIVTTHGGIPVEPPESSSRFSYKRQFVNLLDCDNLLEKELQWLTKRFPGTRFTLKEYVTPD